MRKNSAELPFTVTIPTTNAIQAKQMAKYARKPATIAGTR